MNKQEELIRMIMSKSPAEIPFDDFEEKLMEKIRNEAEHSCILLKNVRLSWFFFVAGTLLGILLSSFAGQINETIFGFSVQRITFVVQVIFIIILLVQADRLFGLTRKFKYR